MKMQRLVYLAIIALGMIQNANAANTCTWTGGGGANHNWSTLANWSCSGTGFGGATLVFPDGVANRISNNDLGALSLIQLKFTGLDYTLSGGTLTLSQGILANFPALGGSHAVVINNNLTLANAETFTANASASGTLDIIGNLNLGSHRLTITGTAPLTFTGNITGTEGITMNGTNVLSLSGAASNYAGTTLVNNGIVSLLTSAALGSSNGGTTVVSPGALRLVSNVIVDDDLTLSGSGVSNFGALRSAGSNNVVAGAINLVGDATIYSAISTESLQLFGTIQTDANTLTIDGPGITYIAGSVGGSSGTGIVKNGSGVTSLVNDNTYSGLTIINGGLLLTYATSALGATGQSNATIVNTGGSLGLTADTDETVTASGVGPGIGIGAIRSFVGASVRMNGNLSLVADTKIAAEGTLTIGGAVTGPSFNLTKSGGDRLILENPSNDLGNTSIEDGTLEVNGNAGDILVNSGCALAGTGSVGDITLDAGATLAPGSSAGAAIGTLHAMNLSWDHAGTLDFQLGHDDALSDHVALSNNLIKLGNTFGQDFNFIFSDGAQPPRPSITYKLVTFAAQSGFFGSSDFIVTYNGTGPGSGMSGNFVLAPSQATATELDWVPSTVVSDLLFQDGFE